jgi:hypothetical protein
MKKINVSLGLCFMLCLTVVSAMSLYDVEVDYNKEDNSVSFNYASVLDNECNYQLLKVYDHKGNVVGENHGRFICTASWGGYYFIDNRVTGDFDNQRTISLDSKNNIKGLGNLRYEITGYNSDAVLAEGRLN